MTPIRLIRLLNRYFLFLTTFSGGLAVAVFMLTASQPKEYQSETEIYTGLASGLNVSSVEQRSPLDFFSTSNAFDNLMNVIRSRQTLEETGERLFARHLAVGGPDPEHLGATAWQHTVEMLDEEMLSWIGKGYSEDSLLSLIKEYKKINYTKENARWVFFSSASPYSHEAIKNIDVYRIGNSDLIKISYKWTDPAICRETLEILNDVFTYRMQDIKSGQSSDVVDYFRQQVDKALEDLLVLEEELKAFKTEHRIINFSEQTKSIAMMKEDFEDEVQKELAFNASTRSNLQKLNEKLALNKEMLKYSDLILQQRSELAELNSQIALMETYYNNQQALTALKEKAAKIKASLAHELTRRYEFSKTEQGFPLKDLLGEWLENTLALDASNARLEIYKERRRYFERVYDEYSPLGSNLSRMEREVLVAERNYLELLHSLNQALMKQKSEAMVNSGLVVTVEPNYPLKPLKSKRLMMVVAAGIVGFFLPLSLILLFTFLDNSVRSPSRAQQLTKLKLLGALPNLASKNRLKDVKVEQLMDTALGILVQNTKLELKREDLLNKKPVIITTFSTRQGVGKTFVAGHLIDRLQQLNYKVLFIHTRNTELPESVPSNVDRKTYLLSNEYLNATTIPQLVGGELDMTSYDVVLVELPALLTSAFPLGIIERSDMSVLVVNAGKDWGKANTFALDEIRQVLKVRPKVVVNAVDVDELEEVVGEIPKRRSFLRRFIKKLASFQFGLK